MLSYLNDPAVKAKHVARFAAHRVLDQVTQGLGFDPDTNRGCFVGCTLDGYDHDRFPAELGWPVWLAHLADRIFEGLPRKDAAQFGTDLLDAVPVGVDLEPVRARFLLTVQHRNLLRLADNPQPYAEQCRAAIRQVIALLSDPSPTKEDAARSARSAADAADADAARSAAAAADAADAAAARLAGWAARSAGWAEAAVAARSAAAAGWAAEAAVAARSAGWAGWAARSAGWAAEAEYQTQRDDLLALLRECGKV